MSKMTKRFAALLMALAMVASMAACNKDDANDAAQKVMNTQAVAVGDHTVSAAMLNYFYKDAITDWYSAYGSGMGLDATKPLNEQILNESTGKTWADNFIAIALENIQSTYALYDLAMAEGFQLSDADQKALDVVVEELEALIEYYSELYSSMGYTYPYTTVTQYLETVYGVGSTPENYAEYCRICTIANAYYEAHNDTLMYAPHQLREYEKDKYARYCSYSFTVYYVSVSDYKDVEAAEGVAHQLAGGNFPNQDAFDAAIKELPINAGVKNPELSSAYKSILYAQITTDYVDWLAEEGRMPGDMGVVAKKTSDKEDAEIRGYYVIRFDGISDNQVLMKNIRHVLIKFEGGVTNTITGITTYSDKEKAAAKAEAEKLLMEYRAGSMTEKRFGDFANQYSDDSTGSDGGLYENLYPGVLVPAVEAWCFDSKRLPGDTSLVETDYGWHILYFVGNSEETFRDYMIANDIRVDDMSAWYESLLESTKVELLDDTYVDKAFVLSR